MPTMHSAFSPKPPRILKERHFSPYEYFNFLLRKYLNKQKIEKIEGGNRSSDLELEPRTPDSQPAVSKETGK